MNTNLTQKRLWWIIGILIGLNLLMPMAYFWLRPAPPHEMRGPHPFHFLEKELDFNEEQQQSYRQLRREHHQKIEQVHQQLRKLKGQLFGQIGQTASPDSILQRIGQTHQQLDRLTFQHFSNVRQNVCNEAQREIFDDVLLKAMSKPMKPGRRGPPPARQ